MKVEYKTFPFEVKGAEDSGIIEGYASTFGNVDLGGDIIEPGAFKRTIQNQKGGVFPILADHNPSQQIGWNEHAEEDSHGLKVKGTLDIAVNQKAREKHSLAKRGMVLGARVGLSIGYSAIDWNYEEIEREGGVRMTVRRLKEVRLWEYSPVTFPMNEEAMVTSAKSWLELQLKDTSDLDELCRAFVDFGHQKGYLKEDLVRALERLAQSKTGPEPSELHSACEIIDQTIKLLSIG